MAGEDPMPSWQPTATKAAILRFVEDVARPGSLLYAPPHERVAAFDDDGTLWCEKPAPMQGEFLSGRTVQWTQNGPPVDRHHELVSEFLDRTHAGLGMPYRHIGYGPMLELLRYLDRRGFANYIASGGHQDFLRPAAWRLVGLAPERICGGTSPLGSCAKPQRMWNQAGRRPLLAFGNADDDLALLRFAGDPLRTTLRLVLRHDDGDREFDYSDGAEHVLAEAERNHWTVVSMKRDWNTVFGRDWR